LGTESRGVRFEIRVELKPGILDAEAESIQKALGLLGIDGVTAVTTARVYTLTFSTATSEEGRQRAQLAVDRLLANPVVHRVSIGELRP
jgi:phosphoribosylformylglycinamidine synthase subunit PurS